MAKTAASKKPLSKSQVIGGIAEDTGLSKKEVQAVFDAMKNQIQSALGKNGTGAYTIPGLVKVTKKHVPARKAEPNWTNPFTGEVQTRPAKPATTKVQVRALKGLKDLV